MQLTYREENTDLKLRKAIGREHLNANRVEDALAVFAGILRDQPEDVESLVILGDLYLASGDSSTAVQLYSRAIQQKKEDVQIEQRLLLAQAEKEIKAQEAPEVLPAHPEAVARLLQRLTGRTNPITEAEVNRASNLLESILQSPNPSQTVSEYLDEIDSILPALIELNIRRARSEGRYDLADILINIQTNIQVQLKAPEPQPYLPANSGSHQESVGQYPATSEQIPDQRNGRAGYKKKIQPSGELTLILASSPDKPSNRMSLVAEGLRVSDKKVIISNEFSNPFHNKTEVVIVSNPHINPQIMSALAACSAARVPIIIDLDTDFEQMPVDHPLYPTYGLSTPALNRAYTSSLVLANLITVPSQAMMTSFKNNGYPVMLIPDGWSNMNPAWKEHSTQHEEINIGWIGRFGQPEDINQIRRVIVRIMREFPDTHLVIAGEPHAYHVFESIPANRRRYLPLGNFPTPSHEEYHDLLDYIDILLVPLRDNPFNRSISDRLLVEASVKGIPWIGSPIPAFQEWGTGGFIARTTDDWYKNIRELIVKPETKKTLIKSGKQHSQTREIENLRNAWLEAFKQIQKQPTLIANRDNGSGYK
jgi:glycosyltransferase involved in cell wall biosynthesis